MEAIIKKLNSMVVKGGAFTQAMQEINKGKGRCKCELMKNTEMPVSKPPKYNLEAQMIGGAKSKRAKLEKMKVPKLQKMAASKGIKITKKKDGKTVYLKKATLVNKLLRK